MPDIIASVPITLDKPRQLRFDRAAVKGCEVALAELWGPNTTFYSVIQDCALVLSNGELGRLRFSTLAVLLWRGCHREDPTLTLETVEEALPYGDPAELLPYVAKVIEAWYVAAPRVTPDTAPAQEAANERDPLAGSTGEPSGPMNGSALASAMPSSGV